MKKAVSFILILMFSLPLYGCSEQKRTEYYFDYFDTVTVITGFEQDSDIFSQNCIKIKEKLRYYHRLFDIYNSYEGTNNLCTVNTEGINEPVTVSSELCEFLEYCKEMHTLTDGKTNIAAGSILSVWHRYRTEGTGLPEKEELENASKHCDISSLIIDSEKSTVFLADPEMSLDVGAVAKGYAAEEIAEYMIANGMEGYSLNIGGNVRTAGARKDGKKWSAAIESPFDDGFAEYLEFEDAALVTSGSYQRYYEVDGKRYHHIIDLETLYPAEYFCSVSVISEDSALADALSTALFTADLESGKELIDKIHNAEAMWITSDGAKHYSTNFKSYLQ